MRKPPGFRGFFTSAGFRKPVLYPLSYEGVHVNLYRSRRTRVVSGQCCRECGSVVG
jgi:hypothetical protein